MVPCEGARLGGGSLWVAWLVTLGLGAQYFVGDCICLLLQSSRKWLCVRSPEGSCDRAPVQLGWVAKGVGRGP